MEEEEERDRYVTGTREGERGEDDRNARPKRRAVPSD